MDTITVSQKEMIVKTIREAWERANDPARTEAERDCSTSFVNGYKSCLHNLLGWDWTFQIMDEALGVRH